MPLAFMALRRWWQRPPSGPEPASEDTLTEQHEEDSGPSEFTLSDAQSGNSSISAAGSGGAAAIDGPNEEEEDDDDDDYDSQGPLIGYHHVLMIISAIATIGLALALSGCSTQGIMQNFHLFSISYRPDIMPINTQSPLMLNDTLPDILYQWTLKDANEPTRVEAVQVGHFSTCVKLHQGGWQCGARQPDDQIIDPLGILEVANDFRKQMACSILLVVGVFFTLLSIVALSTHPDWNISEDDSEDPKSRPSYQYAALISLTNGLAGIMLFIGMAWQQFAILSTATMAEGLRYGSVEVRMGVVGAILGWVGVLLTFLCSLGGILMGVSMHLLDELSQD